MQAQVIRKCGGPEVFEKAEVERPRVKPGHVLIRVAASGVNPIDYKIRRGDAPVGPDFPAVLHSDVSGVIEEVGEGVSGFQPGDEVYACAGGVKGLPGALAEFMLADADLVAPKPKALSHAEAAVLPLVTITAWEGLIDAAKVQAGQHILIHGGTGGVGHVAVQFAKWRGARVVATCGTAEKMDIARSLGADEVVNYRTTPVAEYVQAHTGGTGFDVVLDTVGGKVLESCFEATRMGGQVVSIHAPGTYELTTAFMKGLSIHLVIMLRPMLYGVGRAAHGEILRRAAELADAGKLRPLIDEKRFTFEQAGEAHARLESGEATGKVSLERR